MPRRTAHTYRERLRATLASQGAAYGFTLTVWGSGALGIAEYGQPSVARVFLFVAGPLLAYATLVASLYRPPDQSEQLRDVSAFAFLDVLSVPVSLAAAFLMFRMTPWPEVGLPVGSYVATLAYNLLLATQVWMIAPPEMQRPRR